MKSRDEKKREKAKVLEKARLHAKQRLENALSALGLLKGFRSLPGPIRAEAIRTLPARPRVIISPASESGPVIEEARQRVEDAMAREIIETPLGRAIPALDVVSVCPTLSGGFHFSIIGTSFRRTEELRAFGGAGIEGFWRRDIPLSHDDTRHFGDDSLDDLFED